MTPREISAVARPIQPAGFGGRPFGGWGGVGWGNASFLRGGEMPLLGNSLEVFHVNERKSTKSWTPPSLESEMRAFKTEQRQTKEEPPNLRLASGVSADPCAAGGKAVKAREALAGLPSIW